MLVPVRVLLILADQAEVAVVHHDHDDGDLVLSGHGQLFPMNRKPASPTTTTAGSAGHATLAPMAAGNFVSERSRAAGSQIAPRPLDVLQLARPDLRDAAAGGEHGVGREETVDFLKHAVRLDGHVVVIGLARQFGRSAGSADARGRLGWYPRRRASSSRATSASLASETMPDVGGDDAPIWDGSISMWMNFRWPR